LQNTLLFSEQVSVEYALKPLTVFINVTRPFDVGIISWAHSATEF